MLNGSFSLEHMCVEKNCWETGLNPQLYNHAESDDGFVALLDGGAFESSDSLTALLLTSILRVANRAQISVTMVWWCGLLPAPWMTRSSMRTLIDVEVVGELLVALPV